MNEFSFSVHGMDCFLMHIKQCAEVAEVEEVHVHVVENFKITTMKCNVI